MQNPAEIRDSFRLLVMASLLTVVLWFIPFAEVLAYPFRIFVTLVHELGHAVAALATLGSVRRIQLDWSGSGLTETTGGIRFVISSAGYLSTIIAGSALLLLLRRLRNALAALYTTAVVLLVVTLFFAGNLVAWLAGLLLGFGFLVVALKATPRFVHFFMSFLAIQLILNAFYDLRTLMYLSAFAPGHMTDAQNMASGTEGWVPAIVWAIGWSVLSLVVLTTTLMIYYRSLRHRAELAQDPFPALVAQPGTSPLGPGAGLG